MLEKLKLFIGKYVASFRRVGYNYELSQIKAKIKGGENLTLSYPVIVSGAHNIECEGHVYIGPNSTIYTTDAKLYIGKHFVAGPGLTIMTGDHMYTPGRYIDSISPLEKKSHLDRDVIIEQDVWCGANVTILKGVIVGESAIIAAGAVVTKDVPPYSIVGGIPARVIRKKFTEAEENIHREFLRTNK